MFVCSTEHLKKKKKDDDEVESGNELDGTVVGEDSMTSTVLGGLAAWAVLAPDLNHIAENELYPEKHLESDSDNGPEDDSDDGEQEAAEGLWVRIFVVNLLYPLLELMCY